jgi:hypothetical protein
MVESLLPSASRQGQPANRLRVHGITLIGADGQYWPATIAGGGALRLVHRSDVKLYRNDRALPRAYLVEAARVVEGGEAAIEALGQPAHDPRRVAVLERDPGPPPPSRNALRAAARQIVDGTKRWLGIFQDPRLATVAAGAALPAAFDSPPGDGTTSWVRDEPERVELRVEAARPALLVLRDTFFPGWTATVDGQPAAMYRADALFRAVAVPAGQHTVVFQYRSIALERGLLISGFAALLTALVAAAYRLRPPGLVQRLRGRVRRPQGERDAGPVW